MTLSFDEMVLGPCVDTFGEVAQDYSIPVYTPVGSNAFNIDGVFDAAYHDIDMLAGPSITTARPVFGVRLSQFPPGVAPRQNDQVTIRSIAYSVREVRPDSHGHALLMLNQVSS